MNLVGVINKKSATVFYTLFNFPILMKSWCKLKGSGVDHSPTTTTTKHNRRIKLIYHY